MSKELRPSDEGGLLKKIRKILPEGRALPEKEWRTRHGWILLLAWLHALGLTLFGFYRGLGAVESLGAGALIAAAAIAATPDRLSRTFRSASVSLGLVISSAILVHQSGGYIESHFHFFIMLAVISAYQNWMSFLLAILFITVEHGLTGQFIPTSVFNHSDAFASPWKWSLIHTGFILGESGVLLANWRISERAQDHNDLLLNSAGEGIIGLDLAGFITFANPSAEKITGYPLYVLIGMSIDRILLDLERSGAAEAVRSDPEGKAYRRSDKVILRADGARLLVEAARSPIREYGTVVGTVLTLKEVTARRQAEEERQRTLSLLSTTLEATADGILVVDKEGKNVSLFNDQFTKMWKVPASLKQTVLETRDDRLLLSFVTSQLKDPEAFFKKVMELYRQPEAESFDILELADGRTFERYSKPQWIRGEVVGRVWSFRDITDRKRSGEALEAEIKTLESFVYTISHDLKAPIVSMYGMASMLREECGELNEKAKHYVERIIFNAGYLETLILDLSALSKVGRKESSEKRVEVREVIDEIVESNKASFKEKKIDVVVQSPLPHFMLERAPLRQIFRNLVGNAAKFMGDQPHPRIEIGGSVVEKGVQFFVKDNGIGIDPAYHEKIFNLFHRLNDLPAEGTGVGLSVVKKIIHSYRGKIWLESEKGRGSTFFFWLPQER